jgi:hypothetical protein
MRTAEVSGSKKILRFTRVKNKLMGTFRSRRPAQDPPAPPAAEAPAPKAAKPAPVLVETKQAKEARTPRRRTRKSGSFDAFAKHVESARRPDGDS